MDQGWFPNTVVVTWTSRSKYSAEACSSGSSMVGPPRRVSQPTHAATAMPSNTHSQAERTPRGPGWALRGPIHQVRSVTGAGRLSDGPAGCN